VVGGDWDGGWGAAEGQWWWLEAGQGLLPCFSQPTAMESKREMKRFAYKFFVSN